MDDALVSAAAQMAALERRLDLAAENLAHARTPGWLRRTAATRSFDAELNAARAGSLVKVEEGLSFAPGELTPSNNPAAVAIQGDAFFEVKTPDGPGWTRNGDFEFQNDVLTTRSGLVVQGDGADIRRVPGGGDVRFENDGRVMQGGAEIGRLRLTRFANRDALAPISDTVLAARPGMDPIPSSAADARVAAGMLELPRDGAVHGLVEMITVHRGYDAAQRVVMAIHESYERRMRSTD
ncbi:MAG TPA: flagellar hook basal-body protein [Planctomycetota bacterium]|nr:flagellar hook basal-body protein [Planctomycetota bacterium]